MFAIVPTKTDPLYVKLNKKLGEGSFGKVYEIKYKDAPAALKIVDKSKLSNPEMLKKEVATIQHLMNTFPDCVRNIVCFYEVSEDEDQFYFVSEMMEKDLYSLIFETNFSNLDICKQIDVIYSMALQILDGLDILHKIGIYHRDIKLENFLVGKDKNGKNVLKITDFGLSCVIPDCPWSRQTGSREYLHPDILIDPTIKWVSGYDLYAVGITIYALLNKIYLMNSDNIQYLEKEFVNGKIEGKDVMQFYETNYTEVMDNFEMIKYRVNHECQGPQIKKFERLYQLIKKLTHPNQSRSLEVKDAKSIIKLT
jgi:serine/threonine protein kinase